MSSLETGIDNFDWTAYEVENKRKAAKLSNEDLLTLGYTQEQVDAYDESLEGVTVHPQMGEIYEGTVIQLNNDNAIIDIKSTEDGYIDLSKEDSRYLEFITPGQTINVKLVNDPEVKGFLNLSFTQAAKDNKRSEILSSINEDIAYIGRVKELVTGGYLVLVDDIETFMPGSLAGINKLHNFDVMLGREVLVKPVNFERGNIVVSHREYLKTLIPGKLEEVKENSDNLITGSVTGTTKFGVFCEFNEALTGMILISDLSDEWQLKHKEGKIRNGDSIDFYVKEIISNKKIVLSQSLEYDPWDDIDKRYKVPCEKIGKIVSIKDYGIFIKFEDGITGLLHQSEFKDIDVTSIEEGDSITVNITRIDKSTKKVFLSL